MAPKTTKGWINKELTDDGRESPKRWAERETFAREQTKTKKKRAKRSEKELLDMVQNY